MVALWVEFRDGARGRGVDDETIKTVFRKLIGFSNFGFPKAHSSAFAVLAYQSAWLRQRYPAEFLASLMNAQPMGFYPPATLVRDAQRRGVRVLPPCIARSGAVCTIEDGAVRVGLGYVREVREDAAARLVAERHAAGPFRDIADLAARADLRREQLAQLVRAGACDVMGRPRRAMLWELGVLARPRNGRGGLQLALPIPAGEAPPLPELGRFERTLTDYETMGLSTGWHLVALVRPGLPRGVLSAARLRETPDGARVTAAGLVVARQRPATAGGIVFLLLEDETGMVNCIVRPEVYERHRAVVRADPLVLVHGRLERRERNMNVLVTSLERIDPPAEGADGLGDAAEMARVRAAAPEGQNFGHGRR
jgi:error-prone DNA polymerase